MLEIYRAVSGTSMGGEGTKTRMTSLDGRYAVSNLKSLHSAFKHHRALISVNLNNIDTSNVTNMSTMCEGTYSLV